MSDYGLLSTGFVPQPTPVIIDEMKTDLRTEFGASIDLSNKHVLGRLVEIVGERLGVVWEQTEAVNSAQDPDKATGAALDAHLALTGSIREAARRSTATVTLTGTPATTVAALSVAATESTAKQFETTAAATIVAASAWAIATVYAVDARVTNANRCYLCITAGTSGATGPSTTAADITDSTVHWRYLGEGTGTVDVAARCTETGPVVGVSGDIKTIVTQVSGWESVINVADAALGADRATDEEARVQRGIDLAAAGGPPVDSLRQALLAVPSVTTVSLFVNRTDTTDSDGVPGHHVESLVEGGANQALFDCLLANVGAGLGTHGTVDGTATDSEGNVHPMSFSRPAAIDIWASLDVYFPTGAVPADAAAQVKLAIASRGNARGIGVNPNVSQVNAAACTVAGVFDTANIKVDSVNPPVGVVSVPISSRQRAVWDTARITVNVLSGTP